MSRELVGFRVRVVFAGAVRHGILQGLPHGDHVVLWDEALDQRIVAGPALAIIDNRYTCEKCARLCNRVFTHETRDGEWCADCASTYAQANQSKPTCEECGAVGGAVRNPQRDAVDKRVLCRSCHVTVGSVFTVPGSFTRESQPRPGNQRVTCSAAHVPGTVQCEGEVKPRGGTGALLCNSHAGKRRTGDKR